MAGNMNQYVDLWGSVKYEDRPENHVEREIGGQMKLIHSLAVTSSKDGSTVYVSFFADSWPDYEAPAQGTPVFLHGAYSKRGEYANLTASVFATFPFKKALPKKNEAF